MTTSHLGLADAGLASFTDMAGRAGAIAAIQIEHQESPKKCRHTPGRRVLETES